MVLFVIKKNKDKLIFTFMKYEKYCYMKNINSNVIYIKILFINTIIIYSEYDS